ncbi:hypothetical protein [Actinocrispum wychmicini]|nr:hypothetical protein [Actinocrispum wychmicini]
MTGPADGAGELHISLNLDTPVPPDQQVAVLEALAARLGLS